jgi:hypothetical protein
METNVAMKTRASAVEATSAKINFATNYGATVGIFDKLAKSTNQVSSEGTRGSTQDSTGVKVSDDILTKFLIGSNSLSSNYTSIDVSQNVFRPIQWIRREALLNVTWDSITQFGK